MGGLTVAVHVGVTAHRLFSRSAHGVSERLARLGLFLFEPSRSVAGPTERRRARILAKLLLATALLNAFPIADIRRTQTGATSEYLQGLLLAQSVCGLICYAISRTRRVRLAVWAHVVIWVVSPPVFLLLAKPTSGIAPLMAILTLLPPVLLVNALVSARAALATGLLALLPMVLAYEVFGPLYWLEPIRAGGLLFVMFLVLVVIFGVYRDGIEADRLAELQTRNHELEELRRTLDHKVEARTVELSERNAAIRSVLDHVAQGIFIVASSGAMPAEYSAVLSKWFGPIRVGEPFYRYLGRSSAPFAEHCEMGWQQLLDDILPYELSLAQLPSSLEAGLKRYRLTYERIGTDAEWRILVVVSDATAEVERERRELDQKETFTVFEQVLGHRRGFIEFMSETSELMRQLCDPQTERSDLLRALHTLKGNSMLFGIQSVARICHELEAHVIAGGVVSEASLAALSARWQRLSADMAKLLGGQKDVIEFSFERHAALKRAAREYTARQELMSMIDDLAFEPLEGRLSHFVDHARRLADRFGKRVHVELLHRNLLLDERPWSLLWAVLVHAVRNAIDHGIEPASERLAAGKPEVGRLVFRARREEANFILEVQDDGRGLDYRAIREKCEMMNLPSSCQAELIESLFAEGMSTAQEVSDISGRGIGMGALRSVVRSLAGELFVESEPGRGTLLRMVFSPTRPALPSSATVLGTGAAIRSRAQALT